MSKAKPLVIAFDASPLLINKTGVGYYTDRIIGAMAKNYSDDVQLVGFYYNFLGRRPTDHFPKYPNISYRPVALLPSKIVYQLRRWGIEFPVEVLLRQHVDFILYPNFLGYPSLHLTPSAPVIHDLTYLDLPEYVSAKNQKDLERFVPKQINRSSFVVTISETSKQRLMDAYRLDTSKILVTPIPPEKPRHFDDQQRKAMLEKLGITKPFLLFLGTVEPRKNIPNLIDAYELLPANVRDNYTLVVAGRIGWNCETEIAKFKYATEKNLDLRYAGYVTEDERAVLYQTAELFVYPSHYEGFGMQSLEAMSYGTPCVLSDIPIFHEVAGDAAQYFNQDDPKAIAATMKRMLTNDNLRQQARTKGLAKADSYSFTKIARQLYMKIRKTADEIK